MPQRPRSHQLEEESRRAFEAALPVAWVHRGHDPDYALDYTVDIYENERATSLAFHAQIKATDEPDLNRALSNLRFPLEVADYYRSLAAPVLIVRYHAPSRNLFVRWFHARNPGYLLRAGGASRDRDLKSIAFRFDHGDAWTDDAPARLAADVRGFRKFHSPDLPLPLRFAVDAIGERPHGMTAVEHAFGLRHALAGASDVVAVEVGAARPEDAAVTIGPDRVLVRLGDVASISMDVDRETTPSVELLHADECLGIAVLFAIVGQSNLASTVTTVAAPRANLIREPELAMLLAGAMYRARRVREALALADGLDERGDDAAKLGAFALATSALARGPHLSPIEQQAYETFVRGRMARRSRRRHCQRRV